MQVKTPRDRKGAFEPKLVGKRQTRLAGLDEKILGLYAGGMTVRDIEAHLRDLYGVQIGRDTISTVTDAVLEDVAAWRTRPFEAVYPIIYCWGGRYPMIADSWRTHWPQITPFLALPEDLRHAVYTTNSIENLNRQIRKAIKTGGHFPDEPAATKLIYLAIQRAESKWRTGPARSAAQDPLRRPTPRLKKPSPAPHTQTPGQSRLRRRTTLRRGSRP